MNTYKSDDPLQYTVLMYRPREDTDAWVEQPVKEGDFDGRDDLVCFKPDGQLIAISPDNEVFEFHKEIIRYRDKRPNTSRRTGEEIAGNLRQKTIYKRVKVGVEARFKPIYEPGDLNNV